MGLELEIALLIPKMDEIYKVRLPPLLKWVDGRNLHSSLSLQQINTISYQSHWLCIYIQTIKKLLLNQVQNPPYLFSKIWQRTKFKIKQILLLKWHFTLVENKRELEIDWGHFVTKLDLRKIIILLFEAN